MGKDLNGKELGKNITQRKDGRYQGRYTDRWGRRQTIYNVKLNTLRKELSTQIAKNELGIGIKENMTLDTWFEKWMLVYKVDRVRPSTQVLYRHIYKKYIAEYLGNRKLESLVKSDIQMLVNKAHKLGMQYEIQLKIKAVITDMLGKALEDNLISKNPAKGVYLIADKEFEMDALSMEAQATFFEYCKNNFYEHLFYVAVNTGLRPGELFALTRDDVDFENGLIYVNKTLVYQKYLDDSKRAYHLEAPKTRHSIRAVPMNTISRSHLQKQCELKDIIEKKNPETKTDFLFVSRKNTPLNANVYTSAIKTVVNNINEYRDLDNQFPYFSGHKFRHTFATRCFEQGISPKVVQKYLGHATISMTMDLYTHVMKEPSGNEIEKLTHLLQDSIA